MGEGVQSGKRSESALFNYEQLTMAAISALNTRAFCKLVAAALNKSVRYKAVQGRRGETALAYESLLSH